MPAPAQPLAWQFVQLLLRPIASTDFTDYEIACQADCAGCK